MLPDELNPTHAFVCYTNIESAVKAKEALNNHEIRGQKLFVNNSEIKEIRDARIQD